MRRFSVQWFSKSWVRIPADHRPLQGGLAALALLVVLAAWPSPVRALAYPGTAGIPAAPTSQASFESWLQAVGRPVSSRYHGYRANYIVFRDYKMLVYGSAANVAGNRIDSRSGENSYLGYSYDELAVTNSLFPDDAPGGVTQSTPWQWKELSMGQSARISWARLSTREKQFIKAAGLTYRNNSYGGMTFAALGLSESTAVVLAPPSWHLGFALYTQHYRPGSSTDLRYATLNGQGAGSVTLSGSLEVQNQAAPDGAYVIGSTADHIDLVYQLSGWVASFQGLAASGDIYGGGVGNADGYASSSNAGPGTGSIASPWQKQLQLTVNRSDMGGQSARQFKLQGQVWAVSRMGDICLTGLERIVTIRVESPEPPFTIMADIVGRIDYFSGQTNSQGKSMPNQPHRFLAMEKIRLVIDCSRDTSRISYDMAGQTGQIACVAGQKHYEADILLPCWPSTLSWSDKRMRQPLCLNVTAWDRSAPAEQASYAISDIELTGNVYDIAYVQVR
jgi:hypothetical protein